MEWAADASDEMIFHWLCTAAFNDRGLDHARSTCVVRWNPLYWVAFLVTVLSLFVGREFHILLDQGNAVNAHSIASTQMAATSARAIRPDLVSPWLS